MSFDLLLLLFCILVTFIVFIWIVLIIRQVSVSKGIDMLSVPVMIVCLGVIVLGVVVVWSGYILFVTV